MRTTCKRRFSKLDTKDDKNLLVLDELAVITIWRNIKNDNNVFKDIVIEVDDDSEDLAKETAV